MIVENLLATIGNTPLVKLRHLSDTHGFPIYAKIESFNPSMSIKDRAVCHIIEEAEKSGELKPGMTLIDATSGNTGLSIAFIALIKGYKCVLTIKDNSAPSKIKQLQMYGARVIACPVGVKSDDPLSYYSMAKYLADTIPNSYFIDQNNNPKHLEAHYTGLGPELWEETAGKLTHLIASASTGGCISGVGKFLKEQNKNIKVICADSKGSVLKPFHLSGAMSASVAKKTILEGVGKDIIPKVFRTEYIDECIEIEDHKSIYYAQELLKREGLFIGGSAGASIDALLKYIAKNPKEKIGMAVLIFADHGIKYMGKLYEVAELPESAEQVRTKIAAKNKKMVAENILS